MRKSGFVVKCSVSSVGLRVGKEDIWILVKGMECWLGSVWI